MKKILLFCSVFFLGNFTIKAQDSYPTTKAELTVAAQNQGFQHAKSGISQTPMAQSFWGAGSAVGVADGEFANAFVNAGTFVSGDNPTSWTALSVNESDGAVTPGNAYWVRSLLGQSVGAYSAGLQPMPSPSQANGVALFDSDFLDNGGAPLPGGAGAGTSPGAHTGSLISPRIDLSGYTDLPITANFYSEYREYQFNELSVSLSTDDGATWTTIDYRNFQGSQSPGFVSVNFLDVTAGVANLTQCRMKFTFDGYYYYAMVDDVSLVETALHDLTIAMELDNGNNLRDSEYQLIISNNRHFPIAQMNTHHLLFGANVKNYGANKVLESDNAMLNVEIQENQSGTWVAVHSQNTNIDTVDTSVGTKVWDTLNTTSWATIGDFRTRYVTSLASDENADNDTVYHYFSINDNEYASKVSSGVDEKPLATRQIFPGGTTFSSFEYGSMFEFSNLSNSPMSIDSISFRYYVPNAYTGPASTTLFLNVYRFEDGSNGGNADGFLDDDDGSELVLVGLTTVSLTGLGTTFPLGTYQVGVGENLVDASTGSPLEGLTDGYYLFTIMNQPSLTGGAATFDSNTSIWFGASEEASYGINTGLTGVGEVIGHPSPLKVTDGTGTGVWNWIGFGASITPSLGVHLSCEAIQTTDVRTECVSYTWIDGVEYTADNNTAIYTYSGATTVSGCDSVVTLDLTILSPATGTDVRTECPGYTWIDGVEYNADNNIATHILVGAAVNGCDSTVTLDLTIIPVDITTTQTDNVLEANVLGASYQWLDCNDNMEEIIGETGQEFTATINGDYAVAVTENGCVDTSACVTVTTIGIHDNGNVQNLKLYPNPTTGNVTISFGDELNNALVVVYSSLGKEIFRQSVSQKETTISLKDFVEGIYFFKIQNGEDVVTTRIVKQ